MSTPQERVEAEINSDFNMGSDKAGWPCCYVTADFARTLASELEQAQAQIAEHEATNRLLTATVEHVKEGLAKSEADAAVMRSILEEISVEAFHISKWREPIKQALSTDAGKTMVPRAVLVECRDALEPLILVCPRDQNEIALNGHKAHKSATEALS